MPGRIDNQPYLATGDPATSIGAALNTFGPFSKYRELGKVYNAPDGKRWQKVLFAATLTQASVLNNIVYWSDAAAATVDTDLTDSEGSRQTVAGVIAGTLPVAAETAWVLQEGNDVTLNGTNINFLAGGKIIASATVGVVTATAQATAALDTVIGVVATPVDRSGGAGTVVCNIDINSRLY
jgi:hypothetical protein